MVDVKVSPTAVPYKPVFSFVVSTALYNFYATSELMKLVYKEA